MRRDDAVLERSHHEEIEMLACKGCGRERPEEDFAVDMARATGRRYKCRECSAEEFRRYKASPNYKARLARAVATRRAEKLADPKIRWAKVAVNAARRRAKAKGLPHTITVADVLPLCVDICPALGFELGYDNTRSHRRAAALDRIDNARGYEPDNVWVISMVANRIKTDATVAEIEGVAAALRRVMDKGLVTVLKDQKSATVLPPPRPASNPYAA